MTWLGFPQSANDVEFRGIIDLLSSFEPPADKKAADAVIDRIRLGGDDDKKEPRKGEALPPTKSPDQIA